jgi:hypothetical protein
VPSPINSIKEYTLVREELFDKVKVEQLIQSDRAAVEFKFPMVPTFF